MAIVHVVYKSSSKAPPAAAHAQYLAREGQYQRRGGVELVESGNMPEFAQADPHRFWIAADTHERANGRAYTEVQIALPRELDKGQREELARQATRELLGERFAYTMAIHAPLAKDNIDQPHMHLMFSERAIDETTRGLGEERFFKRNGAKKDPAWSDRNKPLEVREKWVEMMNRKMQREGLDQRLDARSWVNQGREDLAALREPKLLGGEGREAVELRDQVEQLRRRRAQLPAPHLDQAAAAAQIEREAETAIGRIERWRDAQLARLDQAIEKMKEVAEGARAFVQRGVEALRERAQGSGPKEVQAPPGPPSPVANRASPARANPADELARQLEQFREAGRQGRARRDLQIESTKPEPAVEAQREREQKLQKEKEIEIKDRDRGHGHGFSR